MYETAGSDYGRAAPENLWQVNRDDPYTSMIQIQGHRERGNERRESKESKPMLKCCEATLYRALCVWRNFEQKLNGGMHARYTHTVPLFVFDIQCLYLPPLLTL